MTPPTVRIVCARAPRYVAYVPATLCVEWVATVHEKWYWRCSFCGQRVKVVA